MQITKKAFAGFTQAEAMDELTDGMEFARETGNATALAKCIELRMKLHGLLVDKHEVRQASLTIAINGIADPPLKALAPSPEMPQDVLPPVPLPIDLPDDDIFK